MYKYNNIWNDIVSAKRNVELKIGSENFSTITLYQLENEGEMICIKRRLTCFCY